MSEFQIAESKTFVIIKQRIDSSIYKKIKNIVYPQLKSNPYFGANIKKLKGEFDGYYRYRVGSYRLFYLIDNNKVLIIIVDLKKRKNAYK